MNLRPKKLSAAAFDNFLLAHYERATGSAQLASRPFLLLLDPASVCQLQCPLCPTGLENAGKVGPGRPYYRKRGLMGPDLFDALIDELGPHLFFVHLYNWGEPLLNRNLGSYIRRLGAQDITVDIHTNLSLPLTEAARGELLATGIDRIEASIDGFSQETYSRYRVKGRFAMARDNLVRLAALRDRMGLATELIWNFLVFRYNEHEIEPARQFCADHGITFVRREAAISEEMRADFLPSYRQGENLEAFYEKAAAPFSPEVIAARSPGATCAWHYYYATINSDGSVSPCCAPWEDDWDFGAVTPGQSRFADIWNAPHVQRSRRDIGGHQLLRRLTDSGALGALRSVDDFMRQGTLCEGCPMPPGMFDLYSDLADTIVAHYQAHSTGQDPRRDRLFATVRSAPDEFKALFAAAPAP